MILGSGINARRRRRTAATADPNVSNPDLVAPAGTLADRVEWVNATEDDVLRLQRAAIVYAHAEDSGEAEDAGIDLRTLANDLGIETETVDENGERTTTVEDNGNGQSGDANDENAPASQGDPSDTSSDTGEPQNSEPVPDTEQTTISPVPATSPPPKSGAGSGTEKWVEFATSLGVEIPADAGRDQIIEIVEASAQYADLENTNEG